ncbi:MAG: sugar transferase [Polyangiaceae bacterium]|nr:sugar transferase [Polyangiaceae bacterium]
MNSSTSLGRARRFFLRRLLWVLDIGRRMRRAVDVVAAALGLMIALPILFMAACGIKVTSKGPVLFAQRRIGQHGRDFRMLKLRTMYVDAEARRAALVSDTNEIRFKMRNDPRITPIGRWLRRFSIDELPQLWNVLVGDMTLIGPRPALCTEVDRYDAIALRRLEVQQGLTCLWQVSGRSDLSFEQQVQLDIQYIDRTSAVDDLRVLARTIPAVITGKGAY